MTQTDGSGTTSYTWDARNRLVGINGPSVTASFVYDALGRRVMKTINGSTTTYHYDGLDAIRESGPAAEASYLRTLAIDEALTRTDAAGTATYLVDILGSSVALADSSGAPATEYTYEPFGTTSASGSPSLNPVQFTGRENDGTGLYYYRARYYDPRSGRFIGQDPIRYGSGDTNLYRYVHNAPTQFTDPSGLIEWPFEAPMPWNEGPIEPYPYSFDTLVGMTDIRAAQAFWQHYSHEALNQGNWVGATAGDVMGGLLDVSGLPTVQESAETLGSSETTPAQKAWAGAKIGAVGVSWCAIGTTQVTGRVAGQARTSRIIGLRNRFGEHFYTDKDGFFLALDKTFHRLHVGSWKGWFSK